MANYNIHTEPLRTSLTVAQEHLRWTFFRDVLKGDSNAPERRADEALEGYTSKQRIEAAVASGPVTAPPVLYCVVDISEMEP